MKQMKIKKKEKKKRKQGSKDQDSDSEHESPNKGADRLESIQEEMNSEDLQNI